MIVQDRLFIGGNWAKPAGSDVIEVISPITEEVFGRTPAAIPADIDRAVIAAREAFDAGAWPKMSIAERGEYLLRMGALLEPHAAEAIDLQINEMGAPRKFLHGRIGAFETQVRNAIRTAQSVPTREIREGVAGNVVVLREPIGVVAAIIPWNGPVSSLLWKLLPALLTGCAVIIKPAPETPLSAYLVGDALARAGLPPGVVSIVAGGREVGQYLVSHPGVDKVSFTGSTAAGRIVGSICGEQLKPVTLELGGKSAAIILEDVDLERSLPSLIKTSLSNNGQMCVATTRILVPTTRYKEVVDRLVGNPHASDTDFGPLVAARQRDRVEGYIRAGIDAGAKLVLGGRRPDIAKGWYVEPTIFSDVDNSMRIAREEIFGPVLAIIPYKTVAEAIRIANDSDYGLGGGVFTADVQRGLAVAAQMQTGSCVINEGPIVGGGGPFGGYKRSGIGRELGPEGMGSHYHLKSISLPPGYELN
jgi:betaine-aldehyde dehydrogenase